MAIQSIFMGLCLFTLGLATQVSGAPRFSKTEAVVEQPLKTSVNFGPSMLIPGAGSAYPGFALSFAIATNLEIPLYVGVDTGYYFETSPTYGGHLPLMATMYAEFTPASKIRPIIGVSAGPTFGISRPTVFGMLLKPGVNVHVTSSIEVNIESRVGVLGSTLVFMPQIAACFALGG